MRVAELFESNILDKIVSLSLYWMKNNSNINVGSIVDFYSSRNIRIVNGRCFFKSFMIFIFLMINSNQNHFEQSLN